MKLLMKRLLSFSLRTLFLDENNRPELKIRWVLFLILVLAGICKGLYHLSFYFSTYDLMWDALHSQNVSNYEIMCDLKRSKDSFAEDYQFQRDHYIKLNEANLRYAAQSKMYSNIAYDLDLVNHTSPHVKLLKLCALNVKKHFYSRTYKPEYGDFMYKQVLDKEDYPLLEINEPIYGGFYQPPYCVQDYLKFCIDNEKNSRKKNNESLQKINALNVIKSHVKDYNYELSINQHLDRFKKNISEEIDQLLDMGDVPDFIQAQNKLTIIIIPYLRREANLKDLLLNLHSFLQRQFIQYRIIVAEQFNAKDKFNKGRLYNAAFQFIHEMHDRNHSVHKNGFYPSSKSNYDKLRYNNNHVRLQASCIVMHDVDLIPESDLNLYKCQDSPRHLSLSIRHFGKQRVVNNYEKSPYDMLIGGVLVLKPFVYRLINGFSNEYWNWGAEDDDLAMRMLAKNVCVRRPLFSFGTYAMVKHKPSVVNPNREVLLFSSVKRMSNDGLSNLKSLEIKIVDVEYYALYTHLSIHVGTQSEG